MGLYCSSDHLELATVTRRKIKYILHRYALSYKGSKLLDDAPYTLNQAVEDIQEAVYLETLGD